jgi:AAA domain
VWLESPYIPAAVRVWAVGPAESAKTIYFQWIAAKLTRAGRTVVFLSQENPLQTDVDRIARLRPDYSRLHYFHNPGLDLADRTHFTELALACSEADLLVIDTLSASWSGDEASNADVVKLDREVLAQLVRLTGVTTAMIHHTGHPQAFVNRGGVSAGRGASAMGQKADVFLVFTSVGSTSSRSTTRRTGRPAVTRSRARASGSSTPPTEGSTSSASGSRSPSASPKRWTRPWRSSPRPPSRSGPTD